MSGRTTRAGSHAALFDYSGSLRQRLDQAGMPDEVREALEADLLAVEASLDARSESYGARSRIALEMLATLPWSMRTARALPLTEARQILNSTHYGLDDVKAAVLRQLAVHAHLRARSSVPPAPRPLLLLGPPGTGKTSVAKAIAAVEGRSYGRIPLGGFTTGEALRSWSRSYTGARPGLVMKMVARAGARDALILLDELDKVPPPRLAAYGDPSAVLLELLDPEQNTRFTDHFLDVPFDLSEIRWLATANEAESIEAPLLDRMQVIEVPSLSAADKEKVLVDFVLPRLLELLRLRSDEIEVEPAAISQVCLMSPSPGLRDAAGVLRQVLEEAVIRIVEGEVPVVITAGQVAEAGAARPIRSIGFRTAR